MILEHKNQRYAVGNIHGLWLSGTKDDTPKRIEQARALIDFVGKRSEKTILCGDFNLAPDTKSIAIIGAHLRDLIKEYKVSTTRNRNYADMGKYKDYIADYMFVSRDVNVKNFWVLPNEVSDHLPLLLEFS
ncbi:MAG: endonuclease/exonuclease/phosphatase family protein [Patescibacteria group bacterium]